MEYEQFLAETNELSDKIIDLINDYHESVRLGAITNVLSAGVIALAEGSIDTECKTVGAIIMDLTMRIRQRTDEIRKAQEETSDGL